MRLKLFIINKSKKFTGETVTVHRDQAIDNQFPSRGALMPNT